MYTWSGANNNRKMFDQFTVFQIIYYGFFHFISSNSDELLSTEEEEALVSNMAYFDVPPLCAHLSLFFFNLPQ